MLKFILISMRPKQWTKNLILFAGIVFAQKLSDTPLLIRSALAFVIFCLISGAIYLINDIADIQEDRQHPRKKKRPIASGKLSVPNASVAAAILVVISNAVAFYLNNPFGICVLSYFLMMLLYSFLLKHHVILDILIIALGFVLRAYAGAVVNAQVFASQWLLICALFLALFLAISKRRHELLSLEHNANSHRKVLLEYSPEFLDQMMAIVTSTTVVAYALYSISSETIKKFHTHSLILTFPFVVYGILRYLYMVYKRGEGGEPENILLKDKPTIINIAIWLLLIILILYSSINFDEIFHFGGD
jgi:4-hydroxybenzoate polyprenyltransferase